HLAEPAGQQERRRKANYRRPEGVSEARAADGQEQRLPAPGADHVRLDGDEHRGNDERDAGPHDRGPDLAEVNAVKEPPRKPDGERRADEAGPGNGGSGAVRHHPSHSGWYYKIGGKSMGKRELLIALVFVVIGIGAYQLTAPPPKNGQGFS